MDDLISRQAAIEAIKRYGSVVMAYTEVMSIDEIAERALKASQQSMVKILHDLPPAEPERKKGEWVGYNTDKGDEWKRTDGSPVFMSCSICNGMVLNNGAAHWNFCSNCGADMRG